MKRIIPKIINSTWVQHSVFWLLSMLFISWYFAISNEVQTIDIVYALFFHICLVSMAYLNLRIAIPVFFKGSKYLLFIGFNIINLALAYLIHEFTFNILIPAIPTGYYIVSFTDSTILFSILMVYLTITTLLSLSKSWFFVENLKAEATEMELYNLRLQINPHFLLNALNTIYGLSLQKSEQTPQAVLQLSGLLKHILYQKNEKISLKEEIEHIKNYIGLQLLRLQDQSKVEVNIETDNMQGSITPFVLLTFLENAFKHSDIQTNDKGFVSLSIKQEENTLAFNVRNSFKPKEHKAAGIGLENAYKRLELYYPDKHQININKKDETYEVDLQISL